MSDVNEFTDDIVSPDNLKHHTTARLLYHSGVHGEASWTISQWKKTMQKNEKPDTPFCACGICRKQFDGNDNPYIAEFRAKTGFTTKIICIECAYEISRTVIESDGFLHNGKQKFPKYKPAPVLTPVLRVPDEPDYKKE